MADERTERAIEILADGFMDNPVLGWVFQDEATRADGIRGYVRVFLAAYGPRGVLDLDAGGEGAALCAQPGTPRLEGEHVAALVDLLRKWNGDRTNLVLSTLGVIAPPAEPHWYLNVIAARRGARSRGIGARLLEPFLSAPTARASGSTSSPRTRGT